MLHTTGFVCCHSFGLCYRYLWREYNNVVFEKGMEAMLTMGDFCSVDYQ